jgi:hypothetical protein
MNSYTSKAGQILEMTRANAKGPERGTANRNMKHTHIMLQTGKMKAITNKSTKWNIQIMALQETGQNGNEWMIRKSSVLSIYRPRNLRF